MREREALEPGELGRAKETRLDFFISLSVPGMAGKPEVQASAGSRGPLC